MNARLISDFITFIDSKRPSNVSPLKMERLLIKKCTMCKNHSSLLPVPAVGDESSEVLILDSNPGKLQVKEGDSFIFKGTSFNLLSKLLQSMNVNFQDCVLSYAFHCQTQERDAVSYDRCSLWFHYEISHMPNLKTIITLGEDAFHLVMGNGYPKLTDIYGNHYVVDLNGRHIQVLPLMHPWYLNKNKEWLDKTVSIVSKITLK